LEQEIVLEHLVDEVFVSAVADGGVLDAETVEVGGLVGGRGPRANFGGLLLIPCVVAVSISGYGLLDGGGNEVLVAVVRFDAANHMVIPVKPEGVERRTAGAGMPGGGAGLLNEAGQASAASFLELLKDGPSGEGADVGG